MKKVYHQELVDDNSGEIISSRSVYIGKSYERFGMFRINEIDWLVNLSGDELKLLMILYLKADYANIAVIGVKIRDEICDYLKVSGRTYQRLLNGLIKKGYLKKRGRFEYVVNPATFFKGGTNGLKDMIEQFDKL